MLFRFVEFAVLAYSAAMLWRRRRFDQKLVTHWMSACLFLIGLQRLANGIQLYALPDMKAGANPSVLVDTVQLFVFFSYYAFVFLFPYTVLMGCIAFSDLYARVFGVVLISFYFQTYPSLYHEFNWFWPYVFGCAVFGIVFIGLLFQGRDDTRIRVNYKRSLIISSAALLIMFLFFYANAQTRDARIEQPAMESGFLEIHTPDQFFNAIAFVMIIVFGYFAFKYGLFGIKLHNEKQRLESSMTAIKSGTAILNHTIKNELDKLNYIEDRIRSHLQTNNTGRIEELLDHIPQVTGHLQQMIQRIQDKTGDISLVKTSRSLHDILEALMTQLEPHLDRKKIHKITEFGRDVTVFCDPVHMQEALFNLCINAVDAMNSDHGVLKIRMIAGKNGVTIEIHDNGSGIPKELLSKVFEPFYTTKKNTNHFGLGLSYCQSVIRKHSGTLKIVRSEINKGTTIALAFPRQHFVEESIG
ncbi:sensor histidine kinase [Cohnella endophytica]|uniref:histidine kinase n=1 Tax=Cohnella endophytica TaxID=2419778 RepID=A0A494X197_9BACL|nr:HAMP domain-containing sensor histidine kinase [Cohnella endophytica]RKP44495.1 sensor histidine kinase [Cohnella endophytica]